MGSILEKKTEDRISELDDISIEFTLSEPEREKTEKNTEQSLWKIVVKYKRPNIHMIRIPNGEKKKEER